MSAKKALAVLLIACLLAGGCASAPPSPSGTTPPSDPAAPSDVPSAPPGDPTALFASPARIVYLDRGRRVDFLPGDPAWERIPQLLRDSLDPPGVLAGGASTIVDEAALEQARAQGRVLWLAYDAPVTLPIERFHADPPDAAARALWEPVVIDGYALVLENPDPDGSGIPPDGVILLKDGRVHSVWGPLDPGPIRDYLETAAPT